MRWLAQQLPHPVERSTWNRRGDVAWGIPQVDGVDLGLGVGGQEAFAEGQDTPSVGRRALGENADDAPGVFSAQSTQFDQRHALGWLQLWGRKGHGDGGEERYNLHLVLAGPGPYKYRAEYARKVQWIQRACEATCYNVALLWQASLALRRGQVSALYAVDLEVDPPHAGDGEEQPEHAFLHGCADGEDLEEEEEEYGEGEDG